MSLRIVTPFNARLLAVTDTAVTVPSPCVTRYEKVSVSVSEPPEYRALRARPATTRPSVGVQSVRSTVTGSET